jgi:pimeloyl-ACP methyl ester carboxylesterase
MGESGAGLPVVVVNGLGTPRTTAAMYGLVFRARGFRVFAASQRYLGFGDVRAAARLLAEDVTRICAETGAPKVRLVGMSLGGLVGSYYVKCLGGAAAVERFIAIASPLNGSALARLPARVLTSLDHSVAQTCPGSPLLSEIAGAPVPLGVAMYSVGALNDPLMPRAAWDAPGFEPVIAPIAGFPFGHWALFVHPANHSVVLELLGEP